MGGEGGAGPFRYHLELTPAQLKLTHRAVRRLRDELGPEEAELRELLDAVLAKLPDDAAIRSIPLQAGRDRDADPTELDDPPPPTVLGRAEDPDPDEDDPPPTVA